MKKVLGLMLVLPFVALSNPMMMHHRMEMWCQQNFDKCKAHKLEAIRIREKYLPKEKECVEKSKTFEEMRACLKDVRAHMREEFSQMRQRMMEEVKPSP
ncbi:hypothetical protein [Thermocrinis minervae]|uniref:Uncharacterized protein n=1 Tax=Thermocrinis minervae TaxID=381751 RepID=A0A1M6RMB8_9AQUI|nr:hypothetical protein [Thermocrinis minervae]SHK33540.1 hypothetical protein SAMN05444391_0704 [Thermocrinis minervae]